MAQVAPEKRGFRKKTFHLRTCRVSNRFEGDAFDADAKEQGFSAVGYLRHLWNEDRKRRGLEPWSPTDESETEPSK